MSTTPLELPIARTTSAEQQSLDARERDRLIRRAKTLSWLPLAYMTAEGTFRSVTVRTGGKVAHPSKQSVGVLAIMARVR
jgi:hypothetical protein